ncbi:kinase RLK-Pelle-WAK family protein [Tanacetum coccineum]
MLPLDLLNNGPITINTWNFMIKGMLEKDCIPGCQRFLNSSRQVEVNINECDDKSNIRCYGNCINTEGSYNCTCWPGYTGNAKILDGCQPIAKDSQLPVDKALVVVLLAILSGEAGIFFGVRKRKLIKLREKFFEQNRGVFLKQKLNVSVLDYEFISNNTLFYHIHQRSCGISWLSWENRLRDASEAAGALEYLHSQATMPIIHRDVKSTNILLDDNYITKISDFGASRLIPLGHDQVTTLVQGKRYLDPEYFHTSQLTNKSGVYSFGVVLAELITGQKPLCADRSKEEKNLSTYFLKAINEKRLFQIVEAQVLREGTLEQLQAVADLTKRCLKLHGNDRPNMKEVAMELEGLKKIKTHPWEQQRQTNEESRSLTLEVEQSDLYDVPLIPYSTNEWQSYSGSSTSMTFQERKPR